MDTDFLEGLHKTTDISECQRKTKDEMPFVSEEAVCRIQLASFASYLKHNFTFSKILDEKSMLIFVGFLADN